MRYLIDLKTHLGGIHQGKRLDMKVFSFFSVFTVFLLSCGCEKEESIVKRQSDDMGVVIATPYLWKKSLHIKEPMSNSLIKNQIIYNNNFVVPTTNGKEKRSLSLIDSNNGNVLWNWNDFFDGGSEYIDISFHYQYENLLSYQSGASYCINLNNGTTKWRHKRDRSFDVRINGFGQYYFTYATITNNNGFDEGIAFKGDMQIGIIFEYLTPNFTYENPDWLRGVTHIVKVPNRENILLVNYVETSSEWINHPYYGLYDTVSEEWIWDKKRVADPAYETYAYHPPIIANNKIYAAVSNKIVCHDLETGEQLWKRDFGGDFMFTGIIVEEGKVIANCEEINIMYALDAETGTQLWSTPTAGTSSRLSYLNGVVYMVGGSGGGRLFAIEAATGKILWKIDAGLLGEGKDARFTTNAVYVLPAKDDQPAKVIALSGLYAYCFEAIR